MSTTAIRENRTTSGTRPGRPGGPGGPGSTDQDANTEDKPKGKLLKSKKFLIGVVVLVLVGGIGAYKFAIPHKPAPPVGGDVVAMDPSTLNLADGHYLKIAVAVQLVKGKATATDFDTSQAAELVINEFSNRNVVALNTNTARKRLTNRLLVAVKKAYPGEVFDVFVTQFVTQ
jgi:flagellar FliL protein